MIGKDVTVDADRVELSFGSRSVILRAALDAKDNTFTLRAGRFAIDGTGQLRGSGIINVEAETEIRIDGTQSRGAVRMVAEEGGDLSLDAGASVGGEGKILLSSNDSEGDGGSLVVSAGGDVRLGGLIEAIGGSAGSGGSIEITADGDVVLGGGVDLTGGAFDGGSLEVESAGSITLAFVSLDGSGDLGNGGDATLAAFGDVTLLTDFQARGSAASADECGDGGSLDVSAGGALAVRGKIDVSARDGDCWGGDVALAGASVALQDTVLMRGFGREGRGGDLSLSTAADFTCTTLVDFSGAVFGGSAQLEGAADQTFARGCVLDGSGPGGVAELSAGGRLAFAGELRVGSTSPGIAHEPAGVRIAACSLLLDSGATLRSVGAASQNTLTVAGDVVLRGSLLAGASNSLVVPVDSTPLVLGEVSPRVMTAFEPALLRCGVVATPPDATATPTAPAAASPTPTRTTAGPSTTPTGAVAATPTATAEGGASCAGDCNGDGAVVVNELVRLINIALGRAAGCAAVRDGEAVGIPLIVRAVRASLSGC